MIREDLLDRMPGPKLQLEVVRDAIGFQSLRVEWEQLRARAGGSPFLSWPWMSAFWRHVAPGRRMQLFLARGERGELLGVLPLTQERRGLARVWRFLADDTVGSDGLDALVDPEAGEGGHHALWAEVMAHAGLDFDLLDLRDLDEGSRGRAAVRALAAEAGLTLRETPRFRCPFIRLEGDFAGYLKGVGRADNLRRRQRWLASQPGYAIEVATGPEPVARALDAFFLLHRLRWAGDGGSQGIPSARIEAFHREAATRLAEQGEARIYVLRLGERPIASVYMLGRGPWRAFYQSGYDPALASRSPGLVLLAKTIEDAFAEGATTYDFLRGEEPYKFEWAGGERRTVALSVVGPTLAGRGLVRQEQALAWARAEVKRALPQGWLEGLRGLRRRWSR